MNMSTRCPYTYCRYSLNFRNNDANLGSNLNIAIAAEIPYIVTSNWKKPKKSSFTDVWFESEYEFATMAIAVILTPKMNRKIVLNNVWYLSSGSSIAAVQNHESIFRPVCNGFILMQVFIRVLTELIWCWLSKKDVKFAALIAALTEVVEKIFSMHDRDLIHKTITTILSII